MKTISFTPGRMDASQAQTDIESVNLLEPMGDGFRNYLKTRYTLSTEEIFVNKAQLLTLTAPEMTVLTGGMRVLNTNYNGSKHDVFTTKKDALTNDFFVNLLEMGTTWKPTNDTKEEFQGTDAKTGARKGFWLYFWPFNLSYSLCSSEPNSTT